MTTSKNATAKRSSMLATIFFVVVGCVSLISVNSASALSGDDRAKAIAFYNNSIYTAGFVPAGWKIVKRNSIDGSFMKSVIIDSLVEPNAMAINDVDGSIYIVGDDYSGGSYRWMIEKSDLNLTSQQTAYSDPSDEFDSANAVAIDYIGDDCFVFIVGTDRSHGASDAQWRIEKRRCSDVGIDRCGGK